MTLVVGPILHFGGLAFELVLGPLPSLGWLSLVERRKTRCCQQKRRHPAAVRDSIFTGQ